MPESNLCEAYRKALKQSAIEMPPINELPYSTWLNKNRNRAGKSQKSLAGAVGVTVKVIKDYEAGRRVPTIEIDARIRRALGLWQEDISPIAVRSYHPEEDLCQQRANDADERAERRHDKIVNTILFLLALLVGSVCSIGAILVQRFLP